MHSLLPVSVAHSWFVYFLQPFFDEYEAEKMVYEEQMKVYRNSPAYKKFLETKKMG